MTRSYSAEKVRGAESAEKVRGAEINLRKPWQKVVFMAGLAGSILLLLALDLA